ncbi:hypothetical protein WKW79_29780 [Variovorax robiniae]|uniref:Uncharacterized protein n=1 Tax=Variovorax robiniae TaxID=1836199 RepID=A0ABU8XGD7_9BURK
MALLRQCLRELRVKRREWSPSQDFYCDGQLDSAEGEALEPNANLLQALPARVLAFEPSALPSSADRAISRVMHAA